MLTKVELTRKQARALRPLFDAVQQSGKPCAIAAQVWPDGFVAKIVDGNGARKLATALGGNFDGTIHSAADRMRRQKKPNG